jgi:hypothetical protein
MMTLIGNLSNHISVAYDLFIYLFIHAHIVTNVASGQVLQYFTCTPIHPYNSKPLKLYNTPTYQCLFILHSVTSSISHLKWL